MKTTSSTKHEEFKDSSTKHLGAGSCPRTGGGFGRLHRSHNQISTHHDILICSYDSLMNAITVAVELHPRGIAPMILKNVFMMIILG